MLSHAMHNIGMNLAERDHVHLRRADRAEEFLAVFE